MNEIIINILLSIKNQFAREVLFRLLLNFRSFLVINRRLFVKYFFWKKVVASTTFYANTNLEKELKIQYKDIHKSVEIDPSYFLQVSFFNFILQNFNYSSCIEIGSYRGELLTTLATNNPNKKFTGLDINPTITEINKYNNNKNLNFVFQKNEILDLSKFRDKKSLVITKAALMFYSEGQLTKLFIKARDANLDIALAEPTRYQFNHHSKELSRNLEIGFVSYSHNYSLMLKKAGYNIIYDSNIMNLGYYFTKEYRPYFLSLVYASLQHKNKFMQPLDNRVEMLRKFCF